MIRRLVACAAGTAALIGVACLDMSAPRNGVESISSVLLPSPSVVVGDTMRDSTGVVSPLGLLAYDAKGNVVTGLTSAFFVLDRGAHVTATGQLVGDSTTAVRVVGTIGGLQTATATVPVSVSPDTVVRTSGPDSIIFKIDGDSLQASGPLSIAVRNRAGIGATGFVVRFTLVSAPPTAPGTLPFAYIADAQFRAATRDTTDAGGTANRLRAVVRRASFAGTGNIVIDASVQYRGAPVHGSPVRFVIPVK